MGEMLVVYTMMAVHAFTSVQLPSQQTPATVLADRTETPPIGHKMNCFASVQGS